MALILENPPAPPPTPPKPTSRPSSRAAKPPAIQPTLANNTYREGDQVKLQVFITGEPRPRIQWTFNDQPIRITQHLHIENEETGWSRLIIDEIRPEHAGIYTVFAENEAGEARTGASMHVTPGQPLIQQEEQIQTRSTVTVQQSAAIPHKEVTRVVTEGYWTDGQLTGSPTPPPIPRHGMQVRLEEFGEQDVTEVGFSSIATSPEFIRPFLKEHTVNEGEKIRIECLMIGAPRPKVNWYHNERNINLSQGFVELSNVGDTYAIVINGATQQHAGYYKMIAENCRGKTESQTILHVRPREMALAQEEFERQQKMLRKTTQSPLQQQGSRPGSRGAQEHRERIDERVSYEIESQRRAQKHGESRLVTPPPAKRHLTQEHHQKTDHHEEFEIEQQRRAQGQPPHFTQTLVSAVAAQGEDARFEGVVTGWPAPEIEWTKDGEVINRQTHPDINFSAIGGRVSLSIGASDVDHAGKYMCTARNASGVATSSAQLVVRPKTIAPDFIQRLISEEVVEGEQLKWTVRVTGDPQPKVTWLRDGVVIPDCEEVRIVEEGDGVHTLLIVRVEMADCGQFTCLAENIAGEARSTADLVVRSPGADPGNYFHVTKVTQERQVKGEEPQIDQAFAIENPRNAASNFI
ncbi:unnamed protein product, partial [Mesorhabditis belari]|uniref:Ig-like domain-containing protein n=1 Tax=Mesorhabditis belari TaxID=2138241 RepID=A0AAF3FTS3_9BILA